MRTLDSTHSCRPKQISITVPADGKTSSLKRGEIFALLTNARQRMYRGFGAIRTLGIAWSRPIGNLRCYPPVPCCVNDGAHVMNMDLVMGHQAMD